MGWGEYITIQAIVDEPNDWNVAGVTYAAYGPLKDPKSNPWLAQMRAVNEHEIMGTPPITETRVLYIVEDRWDHLGRWSPWLAQ